MTTGDAVIMTTANATSVIDTVLLFLTDNWSALVILIGFGVGVSLFRSFVNRGLKGRV